VNKTDQMLIRLYKPTNQLSNNHKKRQMYEKQTNQHPVKIRKKRLKLNLDLTDIQHVIKMDIDML
jgi:hypothetical protein